MDETFDAHATLKILEDKEEEDRLQATRADIGGRFNATVKGWAAEKAKKDKNAGGDTGSGQSSASQGNASRSDGKPEVVRGAEDKLMRGLAAMFASGELGGPAESSQTDKSRHEKRAEGRAEAKAKDNKQTKG